jgi:hypothetical protein
LEGVGEGEAVGDREAVGVLSAVPETEEEAGTLAVMEALTEGVTEGVSLRGVAVGERVAWGEEEEEGVPEQEGSEEEPPVQAVGQPHWMGAVMPALGQ